MRLTRYTSDDQAEILGAGADPFGVGATGLTWRAKDDHFGIRRGTRLVAHAGVVRLPVAIGALDTEVVGIGGVAVAPDLRGQGLARAVVAAALDHARTLGPPFGLLFCRPPLVPLYQRLGWRTVDEDVHVEQDGGPVVMPLRTMWTPLREDASWPAGRVRLRSAPM
ncbi:GNAT family N-acetyltransferase [Pseudonocardia sp. CA-107938]|uniref:GNAT family N-acetyltransferase n=1 Tax=Pseudonocardia sp. CA-107938 TaxID=3240021 RepID=UPI003D94DC1C